MTTSPPKEHNFDALPTVHALDEFFHRKYEDVGEGDQHDLRQVATAEEILAEQEAAADHHIHLPSPSYWPIVLAFSLPIIGYGVIYDRVIAVVGAAVARPRHLRLGPGAVGRRRAPSTTREPEEPSPAAASPRWRRMTHAFRPHHLLPAGDPMTHEGDERALDEKTSGHGAPDLGNEPAETHHAITETIDEIPMGGVPEPGAAPDRRHRRGAHAPHGHAGGDGRPRRRTVDTPRTTGISNNKLAMWLFLGSECLLFGGLISTYMLYRGRTAGGIGPDQVYDIPFTSVSSFVLLMSSLTMVLAVSSVARGDLRNTKLWLCVTALLGATFVGGQAYEFTVFYREGLGFTTSLFSSSFYTLTGFHGVHVTVGIIMLLALVGMISRNRVHGRQGRGRRARRPVLALRRHRLDRHLHPRLPDPGMSA